MTHVSRFYAHHKLPTSWCVVGVPLTVPLKVFQSQRAAIDMAVVEDLGRFVECLLQ